MNPKIVCEIGSNWKTLDDCIHSVVQAKKCGADAVKFQMYTHEELYGFLSEPGNYTEAKNIPGTLPRDWLPILKAKADAVGIELMCTAFSPEGYEYVNQFVSTHKVASAEATHVRILEKVRSFGKPVILSTGAKGLDDIQQALDVLQQPRPIRGNFKEERINAIDITLMYCVAAYPARIVDLSILWDLEERFQLPVGYSDHTTDVLMLPFMAMEDFQAVVIEKHVNFTEHRDTPDAPHSLTAEEFKQMVHRLSNHSHLSIGPTPAEQPMVLRHNRRIIATRDIAIGECITEGQNMGIYRSLQDDTHAFSPFLIDKVNGKIAMKAISAGKGIGPGDV